MAKRQSELLKEELRKLGLELLDVYTFKECDFIRVLNKQMGRVHIYRNTRKISTLASTNEIKELASTIAGQTLR